MINHDSSIPLYQQVAEDLTRSIVNGFFHAGDRLPSEKQLCEKYGVSRITVRQALGKLLNEGLVFSVQGIGTFVKIIKIQQKIQRIVRFSQILNEKGVTGRTLIREFYENPENNIAREKFPGGFSRIDLVGYVYNTPVVYYSSILSNIISNQVHELAIELESKNEAFSSFDLYELQNIKITHIDQKITAMENSQLTKDVFGIHASPAYIVLESYYYSERDTLLEWKTAYYRSDVYSFNLEREM